MFKRRAPEGDNLETLQRDSWQLELLVTGFALAGMIGGLSTFSDWMNYILDALDKDDTAANIAEGIIVTFGIAYMITLINFFAHVVIRCLWIGAIGSRSVMGDTVYLRRPFSPTFARFLPRRNGSFDGYIERLDQIASLIFAFTFLLIAAMVSFFSVILVLSGVNAFVKWWELGEWAKWIIRPFMLIYVLSALLYLLDFLTAGFLKRFHWFSRVYYPFYRVFGWITMARLYRPLYYNLLNRKGGRKLIFLLVPYLTACLYVLSFRVGPNAYVVEPFYEKEVNTAYVLDNTHYEDEPSESDPDGPLVIPSQIIRSSPLRIRVPIQSFYDAVVEATCPELPRQNETTLRSAMFSDFKRGFYRGGRLIDSNQVYLNPEVIACLTSAFALYLDDRRLSTEGALLHRPEKAYRNELVTFASLDSLTPGMHRVELHQFHGPDSSHGTDSLHAIITVPFYYSPERN